MYTGIMQESAERVAAKREANAALEPRRMTADEKDAVLNEYHPDHIKSQFTELRMGPNKG
ncbi:MAG TPA: succinate dehydrogenase/fumarate reductase flavoprotein subunit, partial [Treponema sp.]|nr:succinate dehydrogenase/fumarate reductase flavoprotein subunit [Treponema sp.]